MRRFLTLLLLLAAILPCRAATNIVAGRVVKVLPLLLDLSGRDAISPSLFDRDAYQFHLLQHPNEVSALRVDVLWRANKVVGENLKIRAELRGVGEHGLPHQQILEAGAKRGFFENWTSLKFSGADYKNFGTLVAWRVTLWNGDQLLSEQKSFLW